MRKIVTLLALIGFPPLGLLVGNEGAEPRPNILWISAEDHGPHLGCYGDTYATTPQLDQFAARSLRYSKASSTAPVCASARTTLITGMYATSLGAQHMRSKVEVPDWLKLFPSYLRAAGYYTSNNKKEDYNLIVGDTGWDDSSADAHWKNRAQGQPFFAVFNVTASHESQIRNKNEAPAHDPAQAPLPPYYPDLPEVREDWAQYYDRLTKVDDFFAARLAELEAAGLAEDTIVFFWADHGSGMPRAKRYPGWSGLHVPLIVHVPDKFKHLAPSEYQAGGVSDRLVGFVDFAPTMLSLAGVAPAEFHEGRAFMGKFEATRPALSFGFRGRMGERPDFCRTVTDGRYLYIRNFYPHLPHGQFVAYQQKTDTTRLWYELYREGKLTPLQAAFWEPHPAEELFDLRSDPFEIDNLAGRQPAVALRFKEALENHMTRTRDTGIFPESMLESIRAYTGASMVDQLRTASDDDYRSALDLLDGQLAAKRTFERSEAEDDGYAYWKFIEMLAYGGETFRANEDWIAGELDFFADAVAVPAAEVLALRSSSQEYREKAINRLLLLADAGENPFILCLHALNALDRLRDKGLVSPDIRNDIYIDSTDIPKWASQYLPSLYDRFKE